MKSCLETLNSGSPLLTKIGVDLTNAATAPAATDLDFASILTTIKGDITHLSVNVSGSATTAAITAFAVESLTIDYSNNGLDNAGSEAAIDSLATAAALATNSYEITFSKLGDSTPNVLEDANKFVEYGNLSSTKIVKASDGTKDCTINSNNVNDNDCDFVVV